MKLRELQADYPDCISLVQGTGLLLCAELDPHRFPEVGFGESKSGVESRG